MVEAERAESSARLAIDGVVVVMVEVERLSLLRDWPWQ